MRENRRLIVEAFFYDALKSLDECGLRGTNYEIVEKSSAELAQVLRSMTAALC